MAAPVTLTQIAQLLGVSTNQVHMWHTRQGANGFPEPIGSVIRPVAGPRKGPLFDVDAVIEWHLGYNPMGWAATRVKPPELTEDQRRAAHSAYARGQRDPMTMAGEAEYQRLRRRRVRAEAKAGDTAFMPSGDVMREYVVRCYLCGWKMGTTTEPEETADVCDRCEES